MAALVASAATPLAAAAQAQRWVSVDGGVGLARGIGGDEAYVDRTLPVAEVLVALRTQGTPGHALVLGLSAGWAGISGDYACSGLGLCPVPFPLLRYRAMHMGWEWLDQHGTALRVIAGLAWDAHTYHVEGFRRGRQVRGDVASPALGPVAVVAHAQRLWAPSGSRGTGMWGVGLGIRLR